MVKGWMTYRLKTGLVGRLTGYHEEHRLYFTLGKNCTLVGCKDEADDPESSADVVFDFLHSAVTINQQSTTQFELIGERNRDFVTFIADKPKDVSNWVSAIQKQRSLAQGLSTTSKKVLTYESPKDNQQANLKRLPVDHPDGDDGNATEKSNDSAQAGNRKSCDNPVFDDPLRSSLTSGGLDDYEWDSETLSPPPNDDSEEVKLILLRKELIEAKAEVSQCRERITSYQEVLASRDRQLFEYQEQILNGPDDRTDVTESEAYKSLVEQLKSYRDQNSLLNEEILRLHQMFNKSQSDCRQHKKRTEKLTVELKRFQRDFLCLLASCVHRPSLEPDDDARLAILEQKRHIATLKALAHEMRVTNDRILGCPVPILGKTEHIDTFGFIRHLPNEAMQVQYLCHHLKDAHDALAENNEDNSKNLKKWRSFIRDHSDQFEINSHLTKLIVKGVPGQYRAYIWQKMIHCYVSDIKETAGEGYFDDLLRHQDVMKEGKEFAKTVKQIAMDVPRTMPNNREFMSEGSPLQERLSNVLIAFCIHCTKIGYCQGFNFLAGGCLLFLEEEDAFWFLVAVTEKLFPPHYYRNGLSGLLADQYVFQYILTQVLPRFSDHLAKFPEVDIAAVTTGWFLGLFFDCLPFQTLLRVWDCFLAFGHEAVFRIACGIIKQFEDELLEINEPSQLLHALKNVPKLCMDKNQLIEDSFKGLPNFPPFGEIEEQRDVIESDLINKHEEKMRQRKEFEQRMMLFDNYDDSRIDDVTLIFDCGVALKDSTTGQVYLSGSSRRSQTSQLFEVNFSSKMVKKLNLSITSRVMCIHVISEDLVLVGLYSGQLQSYSLSESSLCWSMSLSDVVLCMELLEKTLYVGTGDGKLHILQFKDGWRKPSLTDSIELSKNPTTSLCLINAESWLWVASGPAVYVISTETYETDGFFLISSNIVQVSLMAYLPQLTQERHLVWVAVRGSSILQLRNASVYNGPPVLVYDIAQETFLPPEHPMLPVEGVKALPAAERVTAMIVNDQRMLWVGSADGCLRLYEMNVNPESSENEIELNLISKFSSNKAIRCLINSRIDEEKVALSLSECYGDKDAIKWWSMDGTRKDFLAEDKASSNAPARSSSMPVLQDGTVTRTSELASKLSEDDVSSKSSECSSRSLEVDTRPKKVEAGAVASADALKTAMKTAAATAMRTYRDKKPVVRKFMHMLGGNQNF